MTIDDDSIPYHYSRKYFLDVSCSASIPDLIWFMADYSGYIRQAAIERAASLGHAQFMPAFAVRLNDWVPQVRDAARSALRAMLPKVAPEVALSILPSIVKLRHAGRHDHGAWLDSLERELLVHLTPALLFTSVASAEPKIARACFDLLHRHAAADTNALIATALASSRDIVIGREACAMVRQLPLSARPALYQAALRSHFGALRTLGLRGLLDAPASDAARATAQACLFDRQASVRGAAIAYLRGANVDAHTPYLQAIASPSATPALLRICLATLGALRQASDVAVVSGFTAHAAVSVRAAAYSAWLKLNPAERDTIAAQALADPADRIRKLALEMVTRHGAFIDFASACPHLTRERDWPLLKRFGSHGVWNEIEAIARLAPLEYARHWLGAKLEAWQDKAAIYSRPTVAQAAFLRSDQASAALAALAGRDLRQAVEHKLVQALSTRR